MGWFRDLAGLRFERLLVISKTTERRNGSIVWKCLCDCGQYKLVASNGLRPGGTGSCGCWDKERALKLGKASAKKIKGLRFGRLVAKKALQKRKGTSIVWECICDCGLSVNVRATLLFSGITKSCGCFQKDRISEIFAKDIKGMVFGRLKALQIHNRNRKGSIVWECICKCGNRVNVCGQRLRSGTTKSCGCYSTLTKMLRGDGVKVEQLSEKMIQAMLLENKQGKFIREARK